MKNQKSNRLTVIGGRLLLVASVVFLFLVSCGQTGRSRGNVQSTSQVQVESEEAKMRRFDSASVVVKEELIASAVRLLVPIQEQLVGKEAQVQKLLDVHARYVKQWKAIQKLHNHHLYVYCKDHPEYKVVEGYDEDADQGEYDLFHKSGFVRLYLDLDGEAPESFKFMSAMDDMAQAMGLVTKLTDGTVFTNVKISPKMDRCQKDRMDDLEALNQGIERIFGMPGNLELLSLVADKEKYEKQIAEASQQIGEIRKLYGGNFPH